MCFTSQIGYFADPRHTNHPLTAILKYIQALHNFCDSLHGVYDEIHRAMPVAVAQYKYFQNLFSPSSYLDTGRAVSGILLTKMDIWVNCTPCTRHSKFDQA